MAFANLPGKINANPRAIFPMKILFTSGQNFLYLKGLARSTQLTSTFEEAGGFYSSQSKTMQVTKENDTPRSFAQFPQTTLKFQCI